jgi:hypothetical protein
LVGQLSVNHTRSPYLFLPTKSPVAGTPWYETVNENLSPIWEYGGN